MSGSVQPWWVPGTELGFSAKAKYVLTAEPSTLPCSMFKPSIGVLFQIESFLESQYFKCPK